MKNRKLARLGYSPREFAEQLGTGHNVIYDAIRAGKLDARKLGRRTIIMAEDGQRYLDSLPRIQRVDVESEVAA